MLPVDFPQSNICFNKPESMTDEQCLPIKVFKGNRGDMPIIISKWQPNKEDLDALNQGAGLWLEIVGVGLTPVAVYTENPFEQ